MVQYDIFFNGYIFDGAGMDWGGEVRGIQWPTQVLSCIRHKRVRAAHGKLFCMGTSTQLPYPLTISQ